MAEEIRIPEFPAPKPPKVSDKLPRFKENVEGVVKDILGEKGAGKIVGDVVSGAVGVADSVVLGVTKTIEGVVEGIDKTVRGIGRR